LPTCPSQFLACKAVRANYHKRMPAKTTCALVAMLFCFSAIAADKKPLTPEQIQLASNARGVLGEYCGKCHGTGGAYYDEMQINHEWLLDEGLVLPNKPDESLLYTIINKKMPEPLGQDKLPKGKVPQDKLDIIKEWIEAGAPPWLRRRTPPDPPITHEQMLKWMRNDLMEQPRGDRKDIRYFTLTHLYNAGEPPDAMHNYRTALSKLVNSLSVNPKIVNPEPIDKNKTILRIFLTDYAWDQNIWDTISIKSPYPYPYDFNYDYPEQDDLQKEAQAPIPFIRADWFIANAAKPLLYHEILRLPDTDLELEAKVNVPNVAKNILAGVGRNFMRAGFLESGVSRFNRIVERHVAPNGAYWKSYDFSSNKNKQNIFRFPLGPNKYWPNGIDKPAVELFAPPAFQQAGGEIIFTLPNGLQGYFLVDGQGERLDVAPVDIVRNLNPDPGNEPEISNGLSCMTCHTRGMKRFDLRAGHLRWAIERADAGKVARIFDKAEALKTYSKAETINAKVKEDAEDFMAAVEKTGGVVGNREPIALLAARYEGPLDKYLAAGELGVSVEALEDAINRVAELQEYELFTLFVEKGPAIMARESWEENYEAIYDNVHRAKPINGLKFPVTLETLIGVKNNGFMAQIVSGLAWSPDPQGKIIISSGFDATPIQQGGNLVVGHTLFKFDVVNWQPRRGKPPVIGPRIVPRTKDLRFATLAFSPVPAEHNRLAVLSVKKGERHPSLQTFNLAEAGRDPLEITLGEDQESISNFAFSPDGKKIAVIGRTIPFRNVSITRILIVNSLTGKEIARREYVVGNRVNNINRPFTPSGPLDWSPDGDMLAILGGKACQIWDAQDGGKVGKHAFQDALNPLIEFHAGGTSIDWSPKNNIRKIDNKFDSNIAFAGEGGDFTIVRIGVAGKDANGLKNLVTETIRVHAHENPKPRDFFRVSVAWSSDGRRLASGPSQKGAKGEVSIWDPDRLRLDERLLGLNDPIQKILIQPRQTFAGGVKRNLASNVTILAWRPGRKQLAAGLGDGTIRVFDKIK
jgi:WD40 repeat protein